MYTHLNPNITIFFRSFSFCLSLQNRGVLLFGGNTEPMFTFCLFYDKMFEISSFNVKAEERQETNYGQKDSSYRRIQSDRKRA